MSGCVRALGSAQTGSFLSNMGLRTPGKIVLQHELESYHLIMVLQKSGFEDLTLA